MVNKAHRPSKTERNRGFAELKIKLDSWNIPNDAVDRAHDAARASLNEVKALTEYEDGKVGRILTVIAFLSAVVGAVFTRLATDYQLPRVSNFSNSTDWWLPAITYMSFFMYLILVTISVLIVIWAIRPTFNVPKTWSGSASSNRPSSMIFYYGMLDVTAPSWAESFQGLTQNDGIELKKYYTKCYIAESYLVAQKVADKLALVAPGINLLRWAMIVLLLFFILFSSTALLVDANRPTVPNHAEHLTHN